MQIVLVDQNNSKCIKNTKPGPLLRIYILINSHHMRPPLFVHTVDADPHPKKEDNQLVICIISLL
jgi:hypothetical protein